MPCSVSISVVVALTAAFFVLAVGLIQLIWVPSIKSDVTDRALEGFAASSAVPRSSLGTLLSEVKASAQVTARSVTARLSSDSQWSASPASLLSGWDGVWQRSFPLRRNDAIHRFAIVVSGGNVASEEGFGTQATIGKLLTNATANESFAFANVNDAASSATRTAPAGGVLSCPQIAATVRGMYTDASSRVPQFIGNASEGGLACFVFGEPVTGWAVPVINTADSSLLGVLVASIPLEALQGELYATLQKTAPAANTFGETFVVVEGTSPHRVGIAQSSGVSLQLDGCNGVMRGSSCLRTLGGLGDPFASVAAEQAGLVAGASGHVRMDIGGTEHFVDVSSMSAYDWKVVRVAKREESAAGYNEAISATVLIAAAGAVLAAVLTAVIVHFALKPLASAQRDLRYTVDHFQRMPEERHSSSGFMTSEVFAVGESIKRITTVLVRLRGFLPSGVIDARVSYQGSPTSGSAPTELPSHESASNPITRVPSLRKHGRMNGQVSDEKSAAGGGVGSGRGVLMCIDIGYCALFDGDTMSAYLDYVNGLHHTIAECGGQIEEGTSTTILASFNCHVQCHMAEETASRCALRLADEASRLSPNAPGINTVICLDACPVSIVDFCTAEFRAYILDAPQVPLIFRLASLARLHEVRVVATSEVATHVTFASSILDNLEPPCSGSHDIRLYELLNRNKLDAALEAEHTIVRKAFTHMLSGNYEDATKVWETLDSQRGKRMTRLCRNLQRRNYTRSYRRNAANPWEDYDDSHGASDAAQQQPQPEANVGGGGI